MIIQKILKDEVGEGVLVLESFEGAINRASLITNEEIMKEAKTLASNEASGTIGALKVMPRALQNINWLELLLALGTILIIYGFKRITTAVPSTLVALVIMSGVAVLFGLDYKPIEEIPSGLPMLQLAIFTQFKLATITPYVFTGFTLALLGAIDSLLTSVVADNMTKTRHNPNKELIGQGIGNSIASIFGGIPGAGATIRTVVNINSGGKTKVSGMIAGIVLLFVLLVLGPIASKIPTAVLSGILITVGIGVMDYKGLRAIPALPRDLSFGPLKVSSEVLIMLIVLLLSTFWDLIFAVGIGLIISCLMFMKKIGDLTTKYSDVKPLKEKAWPDEGGFPEALKDTVFIKHVKGPLFFGSTSDFQQLYKQIPDTASTVILRLGKMQYMDQSGLYAMEDMIQELQAKNIKVLFVNVLKQPRYMMERIDIIPDFISEECIYSDFIACVKGLNK